MADHNGPPASPDPMDDELLEAELEELSDDLRRMYHQETLAYARSVDRVYARLQELESTTPFLSPAEDHLLSVTAPTSPSNGVSPMNTLKTSGQFSLQAQQPRRQPATSLATAWRALAAVLVVALLGAGFFALLHGIPRPAAHPTVTFQGFTYPWTRNETGGGYSTPGSLENMQSEAKTFHMNTVIIPVVADMPLRDDSVLLWQSNQNGDIHTLPDSDYEQAISDAKTAGLVPILELKVDQEDPLSQGSLGSQYIGYFWSAFKSTQATTLSNGKTITVGLTEKQWFDNYTAFAVHYAQMSQQYHLPYFIFGSDLTSVSYDTLGTNAQNDPGGIDHNVPGDSSCSNVTGRRECEWLHVIGAIRNSSYGTLSKHATETGGGYTGKLIYEASWSGAPEAQATGATQAEFSSIAWWNAVNYIGVDAEFPLTQSGADVSVSELEDAWNGGTDVYGPGGSGDIVNSLQTLSQKFGKPILFTTASYSSAAGANTGNPSNIPDQVEQLHDMEALLETFEGQPWWAGVFWSADLPVYPRSSQPNWNLSSNWAGDTLATSKLAGQWLAAHYQNNPLP